MERQRGERSAPLTVTELIGNIRTPEGGGDWHFEWKTGEPYAKWPLPLRLLAFSGAHGSANLVDGPGENETTVQIRNKIYRTGCLSDSMALKANSDAIQAITKPAEERFKKGIYVGPQKK